MNPLGILASQTAELDLSLCTQREGAIYFLVANGEIVYIGQTERLIARIGLHIAGDKRTPIKAFNSVRWFPCAIEELDAYEGALIRLIRPRYNRRAPYWTGRDNEVLTALGLPTHVDEKANDAEWRRFAYVPRGPMSESMKRIAFSGRERSVQRKRIAKLFAGIETAFRAAQVSP